VNNPEMAVSMAARQLQSTDIPIQPINTNSPIPLYYQVEMDLRALIRSGAVAPDDILPPENELSKLYGVGRQTVRQALSRLVTDGLIARQAGRGTFVLSQPDQMNFYLDRSFTRQIAEMGMSTHSDVLQIASGVIGANSPKALHEKLGAPSLYLVRVRYGNDEPIGLQYTTILTERCPGLEQRDFSTNSLYDVLAREYYLTITEIEHTVTAVLADPAQADLLALSVGEPLLKVTTNAFLEGHDIIETTISFYRASKYEYSTTHTFSS
jgi:GntR family transcriptional regulator